MPGRLFTYSYNVGAAVQLLRDGPAGRAYMVLWRGPGWQWDGERWQRGPCYHLDGGHWDCYTEAELVSAWRGLW